MKCKKCGNIPHYIYRYEEWEEYIKKIYKDRLGIRKELKIPIC